MLRVPVDAGITFNKFFLFCSRQGQPLIRICIQGYNTEEELDKLMSKLAEDRLLPDQFVVFPADFLNVIPHQGFG